MRKTRLCRFAEKRVDFLFLMVCLQRRQRGSKEQAMLCGILRTALP